jgi:hypothetical protein
VTHPPAVIAGDVVAGGAGLIAAIGAFHEFQFHELVGTTAGLFSITYFVFKFYQWVKSFWDKD